MSARFLPIKVLLILAAFSAKSQVYHVSYKKAKDADLTIFQTFRFGELQYSDVTLKDRTIGQNRLYEIITNKMIKKGYLLDSQSGELKLNLSISIEDVDKAMENQISGSTAVLTDNLKSAGQGVDLAQYEHGIINIEVRKVDDELWNGLIKGYLDQDTKRNQKWMKKGIDRLFKNFPKNN